MRLRTLILAAASAAALSSTAEDLAACAGLWRAGDLV